MQCHYPTEYNVSNAIVTKNSTSDVGRGSVSDSVYFQGAYQNTMTTLETCNHSNILTRKLLKYNIDICVKIVLGNIHKTKKISW